MKKNMVMVPFRMEKHQKDILMNHCKSKGMTLSGLIRIMLLHYANEQDLNLEVRNEQ